MNVIHAQQNVSLLCLPQIVSQNQVKQINAIDFLLRDFFFLTKVNILDVALACQHVHRLRFEADEMELVYQIFSHEYNYQINTKMMLQKKSVMIIYL